MVSDGRIPMKRSQEAGFEKLGILVANGRSHSDFGYYEALPSSRMVPPFPSNGIGTAVIKETAESPGHMKKESNAQIGKLTCL